MQVLFYRNSGEKNLVDKTDVLETMNNFECIFKNGSSITSPTLIITNIEETSGLEFEFTSFNYCKIVDLERYYFITDIRLVRQDVWEVYCKVDVLMSFKDTILEQNAFVERNEEDYDLLIVDNLISVKAPKEIEFYTPTTVASGSKVDTTFNNVFFANDYNYVLTYSGYKNTISYTTGGTYGDLPNYGNYASGASMTTQVAVLNANITHSIAQNLLSVDIPLTYIQSITIYPFNVSRTDSGLHEIKLGDGSEGYMIVSWDSSYGNYKLPKTELCRYTLADFEIPNSNSFTDYSPYTDYEIYCPYYGYVKLYAEDLLGCRIQVIYLVDLLSKNSFVQIYNDTLGKILFQDTCNLGVSVALNSGNSYEIQQQRNAIALQGGINALTGVIQLAAGIALSASGVAAPIGAGLSMSGFATATSSIASAAAQNMTLYATGKTSVSSGNEGISNIQYVYIKKTKYTFMETDNDYNKKFGRPLYQNFILSNLKGFTKVGEIHLEGFDKATSNELEEIEQLLKSGIILPYD